MKRTLRTDWCVQEWVTELQPGIKLEPALWVWTGAIFRAVTLDEAISAVSCLPRKGNRLRLVVIGTPEEIAGRLSP